MAPVLVLKREVAVRRLWADVDEDSDDAMDECVLSPWFAMGKRSPACDSSSSTEVEGYTSEEKGCGSEETSETLRRFEGAPAVSSEVLPVGVPAQCPETDEAGASRSAGSAAHSGGKCRPCLFFRTPEGCASGIDCRFCHEPHIVDDTRRPCKSRRDLIRKLHQKNLDRLAKQQPAEAIGLRDSGSHS
mmetsp:Transcript_34193/g.97148  ORF Transcript_34193/g.97148 Transcript_34193/m.97148 type:complete len:188 (-) Transcript_34193:126-689(-)